jgi:hypothetical protein
MAISFFTTFPVIVAVAVLLSVVNGRGQGDEPKPLPPAERLKRGRLSATHAAVAALQKLRQDLPPVRPGLNDYRCIFHAHAGDSEHTGGTLPEMLADARKAGVHAIFLGSHHRPPRDFMESWRGLHEGVLFIPGAEARGFLVHPEASILSRMEVTEGEFIAATTKGEGLIFLSHVEERADHPMEGLHGLEIYNRHYDAKRDMAGLIALAMRLTSPKEFAELADLVKLYPDELLAAQVLRQEIYLDKWDAETAKGRRLTGVAANDCHHNQIFVVKMIDESRVHIGTNVDKDEDMRVVEAKARPGISELTRGHQPGDTLSRVDIDPYYRSFRNASTHVLAAELTEPVLRAAVKAGHAYVSHDWLCDPTGFEFSAAEALMGDEIKLRAGLKLHARAPIPCRMRLLRSGVEMAVSDGRELSFEPKMPGVYRIEASIVCAGDLRTWIYSNPIYVR